ncbi:major facilitator superfamily domain-containing protein [Talaromyces proteolyticus]|uniref:Major facilitator superfamily domain-containing protein n=1 Tax=Talaromyces proteolyticus TaxID=1131652 RepID=A0AAD4L0E3_9EURO|nr:major facilitator superfamily domain-containing protein [Talaromyces proteolyticus]KAH8703200.1 major facilitator superfamily domain-containing protein [Talaromyces proteolyticus]
MRSRSPSLSIHSKHEAPNATVSQETIKRPFLVQQHPTQSQSSLRLPSALRDSGIELQQYTHGPGNVNDAGQPWISGSLEVWMIGCFAIMAFMVSLDALIMVTTLKNISQIYDSSYPRDATWPITVYFLLNIPIQRVAVAATEMISRRFVLISGISIFSIGVILLSAAPVLFPILLVGRGLQGMGSGVMTSVAPAMLTEMIPPQRRSRYNCAIFFAAALGVGLGPALGGVFLEDLAIWRWIYYISAPFCFILLMSTPFAIRPVGEILGPKLSILSIDWTGICFLMASLTALVLGITWAGVPDQVTAWRTLFPLAAGIVCLVGTVMYERSGASKPIFSFQVLKTSPVTFVCVFIHSLVMFIQVFYVPEFLQGVYELSPSYMGALLVPLTSTSLLVTAITGIITERFRAYRWAIWSGWALTIASAGCMTIFSASTSLVICVIVLIVAGVGHGLVMSGSHTAIQRMATSANVRDALLLSNFIRTIAICVAVSAGGTTFQARFYSRLFQSNEVYALTFRDIMYTSLVLAGLGGLLSLLLAWRKRSL